MHIGISAIVVSSALGNRIARGGRPEQTFGAARDCLAEIAGPPASQPAAKLGLRENWRQFSLLVLVNAFVGGMVGLERTVVPLVGSEELRLSSATVIASFIASF